jgi:hypothetical protein
MENNHLIELLQDHPDLTEKVLHVSSSEEALELVKSIDSSYTLESLEKDLDELTASSKNEEAELNFDQLDTVAGGVRGQKNVLLTSEQMDRIKARLGRRHGL